VIVTIAIAPLTAAAVAEIRKLGCCCTNYLTGDPCRNWVTDCETVVYYQIKILTEEGRKYADIEVPFFKDRGNVVGVHAQSSIKGKLLCDSPAEPV
jgi:uncharacterized protein (DUF488 family)